MRLFKRISLNRKPILQHTMSYLSLISMALGAMFSLPDSIKENYPVRILLVLIVAIFATVIASVRVICFLCENILWEKGKAAVSVIYGDLMKKRGLFHINFSNFAHLELQPSVSMQKSFTYVPLT